MENEHSSYTTKGGTSGGSVAADFLHKAGSGRVYYQATTPFLRPDGVTPLSTADAGRLFVDSDSMILYLWDGARWLGAGMPIGSVYIQFPGQSTPANLFAGTWTNISSTYAGDFFRAEGGAASAFESGEQAASIIPAPSWRKSHFLPAYKLLLPVKSSITEYDSETTIVNGFGYVTSGYGEGEEIVTISSGSSDYYGYTLRPVNRTVRIWTRTA